MPEEAEVEEQEEKAPPKKKNGSIGKMLMIIVLALVSSAGGGVVSFMLISRTLNAQAKAAESPEKAAQEKIAEMIEKSAVIPLEPFVVNLADPDAARYLRIKISLMVDDKNKVKEVVHETKSMMPAYKTLSAPELQNLLAYLSTLRGQQASGAEPKKAQGIH